MQTKIFEIRDVATAFSLLETKLEGDSDREKSLVKFEGYQEESILVGIPGEEMTADPYKHTKGGRSIRRAHKMIRENFEDLDSGSIIDIEKIKIEEVI